MLAEVLVVALVLALLADVVTNLLRPGRSMAQIEARPDGRIWFYRRFLFGGWTLAVFALLPVVDSGKLTLADLGLTWSGGGVAAPAPSYAPALAWVLTAFLLAVLVISGNRLRRHVLAGGTVATREKAAPMFPRTPRERGLATAVAVTAGITEEIIFRGLLVAAGVALFDLPLVAACALSIVLFAATHLYQGPQGVYGAAALAVAFTGITVLSGTLLPAIILHVIVDLIAFLHIPPPALGPTPAEAHPSAPHPGAPRQDAPHQGTPWQDAPQPVAPRQNATQPVAPRQDAPQRVASRQNAAQHGAPRPGTPWQEATQPSTPWQEATQPGTPRPGAPTVARPSSAAVEAGALTRAELTAAPANGQPIETPPTAPPQASAAGKAGPPSKAQLTNSQPIGTPSASQPGSPRASATAEAAAPKSGRTTDEPPTSAKAPGSDQVIDEPPASATAEAGALTNGQVTAVAEPVLAGAASGVGPRHVPVVPGPAPAGPLVPKLRRPAPGA
ncbi:CPBP family intramembrane glutamic endopeptidase [Paractinoplanes atraurantiacus]|uniref:Membrane protease YdiL, CAAX protease family n=1 Tax=Paractinoplanes atraurantiacus TaxID=1036182 RepID=A0A285IU49_9ACTN|nr:CPBP family intramembrane glutamic endopeptidase [Actinoplanes atraurantiacus]SNY50616.1 Membrane protease YdiL, CAAX protease family [Actinoplanes atraurantiacus]